MIQRIPKSNILPQSTNDREQSFQLETFHSTPRMIQVQPIKRNGTGDLSEANVNLGPAVLFNNHKYNKNIINLQSCA